MQRELPILYSTQMVRAILAEQKDTTRRAINPQPEGGLHDHTKYPMSIDSTLKGWWGTVDKTGESKQFNCPYGQPGDRLYVREEHYRWGYWVENGKTKKGVQKYRFVSSNEIVRYFDNAPEKYPSANRKNKEARTIGWYKRNARFMPKSTARIWLEVMHINAEQLQDITEEGARAEGILRYEENGRYRYKDYTADASGYGNPDIDYPSVGMPICSFSTLWQFINGPDSWDANPWVWVIKFKVLSTTGKPELKS